VYGGDIVPQSSYSNWIQTRWKRLFGSGAVAALIFVSGLIAMSPHSMLNKISNLFLGASLFD
jgi:hypothetical protein